MQVRTVEKTTPLCTDKAELSTATDQLARSQKYVLKLEVSPPLPSPSGVNHSNQVWCVVCSLRTLRCGRVSSRQ